MPGSRQGPKPDGALLHHHNGLAVGLAIHCEQAICPNAREAPAGFRIRAHPRADRGPRNDTGAVPGAYYEAGSGHQESRMQYQIKGTVTPHLEVQLGPGETVFTESGAMAWMDEGVSMSTGGSGGIGGMLGRMVSGESAFVTKFTSDSGGEMVAFVPELPGSIVAVELGAGESIIAQKDSFLVAEESVTFEITMRRKLGAGLFGGEGFILQKFTGPGTVFAAIGGEVQEYDLASRQTLKVDPGHLAMFEPSVNYDIARVKGVRNILFGGEGLFLATVTGPGKVWLQRMPMSNLVAAIARHLPKPRSGE